VAPHPAGDGGVALGLGDQVTQKGAGAEEAQADVGGLGEVPQHRRVREVLGAGPPVDERHHDLDGAALASELALLLALRYVGALVEIEIW